MTGILLMLLGGTKPQEFVETITFNGSATWTCPTGVSSVDYLVVGGGGGGGSGDGVTGHGGGSIS